MKHYTLGQYLFDYLYKEGVKDAFGIPGDFVLPTIKWLDQSKIRFFTLTHEPAVGFAADCYARSRNGLGLAVVTYCVGGLNMVNSIACAYAEKSPVIVISGGPSPLDKKKDPLLHHKVKNFDTQLNVYKEVTCAATILDDLDTAASEIHRVVEKVKYFSRPGYIEVPFDLVNDRIHVPRFQKFVSRTSNSDVLKACVKEITGRLQNAKKPVILAGVEIHRLQLADQVTALAKKLHIPIASTLLSKGVIRETNPLYIGVYSGSIGDPITKDYVESSDCVLMLGTFITDMFLGVGAAKLTSESSMLCTTEEMRIGFHYYQDITLPDIISSLYKSKLTPKTGFKNPNPLPTISRLEKKQYNVPITSDSFFNTIARHLKSGSSLVCDTGDALLGAAGLRIKKRKHFFADSYYLSMGFAIPGAIGVMVANPRSRAIVIVGDGAFQMTGTEISTMAKYQLKPIICILNNDGYGTQRHIVDGDFNNIHCWDYTKITELMQYGVAISARSEGEFDKIFKKALTTDDLVLIEVKIDRDDCSKALKRLGEELHNLRN